MCFNSSFCLVLMFAASVVFLAGCGGGEVVQSDVSEVDMVNDTIKSDDYFLDYLDVENGRMRYTSRSDSALFYYNLGWHQIMDEGRYAEAELSYRKSLKFDPDFLICQAVLGRLTLDDEERAAIYESVELKRGTLPADEEKLLSVYHDFVHYTNLRERGDTTALPFIRKALLNGEKVFRGLVHKYSGEPWLKSEYVEFINSNHGAEVALDSLAALTRERHAENPFLLGFGASLKAETGELEEALNRAERLEALTNDKSEPKPWAVLADVYFQRGELELAKQHVDRAVQLDSRNLDASRLQTKVDAAIAALSD
ncbi:hypothetical protein FUA23_11970 [Neolewinella aurantiaca]|uniref:Tetratricopeptide repeat protein n=1 Tax=Neolewinella aurantiaca TaxID=2602767 RepID=A0A5C7FR97_9BACT|nr:tetratricopeptide repeat protein [Neolewinella aurantiaca]TXF88999.1 hypothetical protein FUA23_11970 [Neolewinella aurantiaca]